MRSYPIRGAKPKLLTDNNLLNVELTNVSISPTFDKDITDYSGYADNAIEYFDITPYSSDKGALIEVNGVVCGYGRTITSIPLLVGNNENSIVVTSEAGVSKTYNFNINRLAQLNNMVATENSTETITNALSGFVFANLSELLTDKRALTKYQTFEIEATRTFTNTPRVTLYFEDATSLIVSASAFTMTTGSYISLGFSHDCVTGTTKIYINGELNNTVVTENKIGVNLRQNAEPILIGCKKWEESHIFYTVRDPRVYNSVLADSDFETFHNFNLTTLKLDSFSPTTAVVGDSIQIRGSNILSDLVIHFDDVLVTSKTLIDPYTLNVVIPNGITDLSYIILNSGGETVTSTNQFTKKYPPLIPTITSINPLAGNAGDLITIIGTNFNTTIGLNRVLFGSLSAVIETATNTQLQVRVPTDAVTDFITVYNDSVFPIGGSVVSRFEFPILQSNAALLAQIDAASDGDTINVPEGAYLFIAEKSFSKNLRFIGAGQRKTYFVFSLMTMNYMFRWTMSNTNFSEISGITFMNRYYNMTTNYSVWMRLAGSTNNFRIHHCDFIFGGGHGIFIWGAIYGVIDHCYFYNAGNSCIDIYNGGRGNETWGDLNNYLDGLNPDGVWPLGDSHAVYIEDCEFYGDAYKKTAAVDGSNGARYVFRHNYMESYGNSYPFVDAHGNYEQDRSNYSAEIYDNEFVSRYSVYYGLYIRGGTGVIFNNTFSGLVISLPINFTDYRSFYTKAQFAQQYPGGHVLYPNWTDLADEVGVNHCPDLTQPQNDYCDNVYPAPDQVYNFYVWNNFMNGVELLDRGITNDPFFVRRNKGLDYYHIQRDRDFFLGEMPGYTPYTYPHPLTIT